MSQDAERPVALNPEQLSELVRKELAEGGGPAPATARPRPRREVNPEVQKDLDALLASIRAGIPRRPEENG